VDGSEDDEEEEEEEGEEGEDVVKSRSSSRRLNTSTAKVEFGFILILMFTMITVEYSIDKVFFIMILSRQPPYPDR